MPFTVTSNAASTAPSWAAGMTLNQWYAISGASPSSGFSATNTIDDVVPEIGRTSPISGNDGPDAICKAWAGGAFASNYGDNGTYIIWNGGHNNYYGNEVYGFDMGSRTWSTLTTPYSGSELPGDSFDNGDGWFSPHAEQVNGSPGVPHTYDFVFYHPSRNSFFTLRAARDATGNANPAAFGELTFSDRVWKRRADGGLNLGSGGWSALDTSRNICFAHGGGGLTTSPLGLAYDIATDTPSTFNPSNDAAIAQLDSVAAYNSTDDFVAVIRPGNGVYVVNPASPNDAVVQLATSGLTPSGQSGFEWSAEMGAFLYKTTNGNTLYKLVKTSASPAPWGTWAWQQITTTGATIENMEANGIYSKFQVAEYGSTVIAMCVKRTGQTGTGAVYAVRLQ